MDITATNLNLPVAASGNAGAPVPVADGNRAPPGGNNVPPAAQAASRQTLDQAVAQIQSYLGSSQRELQFSIDKGSGQTVIRVLNPSTGDVVRQIPSEEVLKMAEALSREEFHIFDQKV